MGTRSRIVIRRYAKRNIYLWMHYDGYISGQGLNFYKCVKTLLDKYRSEELYNIVQNMDIKNLEDGDYQAFDASLFSDFIEGKTNFLSDDCRDIEYEYVIDFRQKRIVIYHNMFNTLITFDMIKSGFDILSLEEHYEEYSEK